METGSDSLKLPKVFSKQDRAILLCYYAYNLKLSHCDVASASGAVTIMMMMTRKVES
jgi:hypothetical protein